jgi:hypothetical protein
VACLSFPQYYTLRLCTLPYAQVNAAKYWEGREDLLDHAVQEVVDQGFDWTYTSAYKGTVFKGDQIVHNGNEPAEVGCAALVAQRVSEKERAAAAEGAVSGVGDEGISLAAAIIEKTEERIDYGSLRVPDPSLSFSGEVCVLDLLSSFPRGTRIHGLEPTLPCLLLTPLATVLVSLAHATLIC